MSKILQLKKDIISMEWVVSQLNFYKRWYEAAGYNKDAEDVKESIKKVEEFIAELKDDLKELEEDF